MKKSFLLLVLCVLACLPAARAQIVTTTPSPLQEDSKNVEIYFHADKGNKGLMNVPSTTAVYAHTGVCVTDAGGNTTQWKYAPVWLDNSPKYQLQYVEANLWKLVIGDIRTYYGVAPEETVTRLCFVFRNGNGTKEGKGEGNTDIFVDVLDSGFQLALSKNIEGNIVTAGSPTVTFTASTTQAADITLSVDGTAIGQVKNNTLLNASYTFSKVGNFEVKATATSKGQTIEESMTIVYARASKPSTATLAPMGLTKNADGSYTFCLAAPQKSDAMVIGSWNDYQANNDYVMDYIDRNVEGANVRYFQITLPASVTGNEFGYYYLVDNAKAVGDPYARLILDPSNDKYISETVYPGLPPYPEGIVPANTAVAWHGDNMLAYDWKVKNFKGAAKDNLVIYELLFRDFTGTEGKADGNGTVRRAIDKLGYIKDLGVNAIELLPVNEFNGNNSWGYNPNFYFAIDKAYGTPQDYKEFIDKCHELDIAVILDVVFNQADWLHPWYMLYSTGSNPFFNASAPHAYSVLNDWNQGYPLVQQQWKDMLKFWLTEYKVDGFRFDLVKGLGNNDSYANSGDSGTNAYNASRVARMKSLHDAMREVNPDAYFINENLAGAKEENEMAADGELNWANVNNAGCQYAMGYQSDSDLSRMWALRDSRTAGSTVAYLESHDEQRLAYKQDQWGASGVKGNHKVSMQRCGSAAAQMILVPGTHMIWMFSEMGNAQNTKDNNGGNNTSPKIVNWNLLNDPDNAGLVKNYTELINIRLGYPELFAAGSNYTMSFSNWNYRTLSASSGNKELYAVMNPSVTAPVTVTVNFQKNDNSAYHVASCSFDSNPTFDAAAKTVTVPANCYAVISTTNISGIGDINLDATDTTRIFAADGAIRVVNNDAAVEVYTLDGVQVATARGDATIAVNPALYIVRAGAVTAKVLVK